MQEDPKPNCLKHKGFSKSGTLGVAAWPFLLFALLTIAYHWPLLSSPSNERLNTDDITLYLQWLHQYSKDELLAGRLPLWNPYNYGGVPFAANPQTSIFYPLSWLYLFMPVIQAHKWMIALHTFLAASFMYLFLRRINLHQVAAWVCSLPWAWGSYFMANAAVGHLNMLFTMVWLPLVLLLYDLALSTRRFGWMFWSGFFLGVQLLAGEPQNSYYTIVVLTLYGLVRTVLDMPSFQLGATVIRLVRWAACLAGLGLVAVTTSAVQLFMTAEMARHSDRAGNSFEFVTALSFWPSSFLGLLMPWAEEDKFVLAIDPIHLEDSTAVAPILEIDPDRFINFGHEFALYVGLITLVLAALSLAVRNRPALRAAQVSLVVAVVLMLGGYTPVYQWLYSTLPGLGLFRVPARSIIILVWAICVLSGYGMDWLIQGDLRRWQRGWWSWVIPSGLLVVAVFGVGLIWQFELWPYAFRTNQLEEQPLSLAHPRVFKPLICLLLTALVLIGWRWSNRQLVMASIAVLLVVDLFLARPRFPLVPFSAKTDPSLLTFEQMRTGQTLDLFRVDLAPAAAAASAAIGARVENINGYWPVALERFYRFAHEMRGQPPNPAARHQFHNELYEHLDPFPLRIMNVHTATRLNPARGRIEVLANQIAVPRAWVVDQVEVHTNESKMLDRLKDRTFDPQQAVLLGSPPEISLDATGTSPGTTTTRRLTDGTLEIQTQTNRSGYLVLSELFYPGWQASLDGKHVQLERANHLITAMALPAGAHRILYYYEPLSFKLGAGCTILICMIALGFVVTIWRSRWHKSAP